MLHERVSPIFKTLHKSLQLQKNVGIYAIVYQTIIKADVVAKNLNDRAYYCNNSNMLEF